MEENKIIEAQVVETTNEKTGETKTEAEVKKTFGQKLAGGIKENRGKLGVLAGIIITVGASLFLGRNDK